MLAAAAAAAAQVLFTHTVHADGEVSDLPPCL